ncbi:MAG: ABC transporter ATP-binding protein [Clostridia bacterium]|nr:ABC transporter ATP-binding protein [Clostridia bacterium]
MKDIWKRLKKYRLPLVSAFVMLVLSTVCSVTLPTLMTNIVDYGINAKDIDYVYRTCAIMAAVTAADVVLVVVAYKIGQEAVAAFCGDLRAEIFAKANAMPMDAFKKMGTGALITRSIEDVDRVGDVLNTLMSALSAIPFTMILGTVLAFRKDPVLALILFAFVPVILAVVVLVSRRLHPLWKLSDEYMDKQNALIRSRLSGIRVVRAFNRESAEQEKIDKATHIMAGNIINANIRAGLISPVCMLVLNLVTVLILYVGAFRITLEGSKLTVGGILAVIEYVGMIMSGIMTISFSISEIPRARVNCMRLGEVLSAESIPEATDTHLPPFKGAVSLKKVGYRYPGSEGSALSGVDMEIAAGEKVALIGGTGSGKSTLVRLLTGLSAPTEGELLFDGKPVSEISEQRIRDNVSCVLQKDTIFSGTIGENVAAGRQVSDEEINAAIEDARLAEFVEEQKEKLAYPVTQRGGNLSGGQKQRLAIARAILKPAAIYIFDDSFSALDFMTESKLRARLAERLKGKTQIIVTQRVTTAMNCDKIYVFDAGTINASGTHSQLMESCGIYREIYLSQTR